MVSPQEMPEIDALEDYLIEKKATKLLITLSEHELPDIILEKHLQEIKECLNLLYHRGEPTCDDAWKAERRSYLGILNKAIYILILRSLLTHDV